MKICSLFSFSLYMGISFAANLYRTNMHNGWLLVRGAFLRSWLNFHQQGPHLVSSLQQLPHACSPDTIQSHHPQGTYTCLVFSFPFSFLGKSESINSNHVLWRWWFSVTCAVGWRAIALCEVPKANFTLTKDVLIYLDIRLL